MINFDGIGEVSFFIDDVVDHTAMIMIENTDDIKFIKINFYYIEINYKDSLPVIITNNQDKYYTMLKFFIKKAKEQATDDTFILLNKILKNYIKINFL